MPVTLVPYRATDGKSPITTGQLMLLPNGVFYSQYGATTAIADTTTATSLFNNSSTTVADLGLGGRASSLTIKANSLQKGTIIRGVLKGTISNTGTPDLTVTAGLTTTAGVYTAYATTGAVTMTTVSGVAFITEFEFVIKEVGSSGTILGQISRTYDSTTKNVVPASASIDLTVDYTIDAKLTWSAASASNTCTVTYAYVEVVA